MIFGLSATIPYRQYPLTKAEKVVVREGFKPGSNLNNIALLKFKKFENQSEGKFLAERTMPICLPNSRTVAKKDKPGFTVGFNLKESERCRTNEIGPDVQQDCAKTTIYGYKGEPA